MATNYPPYVNAYGSIATLLTKIKEAAVPPKFTQDFLVTVLALKSTSYRAMIPLLKRLGLLDGSNVPTQAYRDLRDEEQSRKTLARLIRTAYNGLFSASEYAYRLKKEEVVTKLRTLLGVGVDDQIVPSVAGTFLELCKHGDFEAELVVKSKEPAVTSKSTETPSFPAANAHLGPGHSPRLALSYTINLNLPATTEVEVFNAIFKSLKEHILTNS